MSMASVTPTPKKQVENGSAFPGFHQLFLRPTSGRRKAKFYVTYNVTFKVSRNDALLVICSGCLWLLARHALLTFPTYNVLIPDVLEI